MVCFVSVAQVKQHIWFLSYLFCKKIPLSRRVEYVMDGSMDEWVSESVSQWVSESVSQWVSESVSQWVSESVSQWVSESVSQWVRDVCMSHQSD